MLPSCGCSQFSLIVGIGPRFSRSMCVASIRARWNFLSSVIAEQTSVGPIFVEHLLLRALDHRARTGTCTPSWRSPVSGESQ